MIKNSASLWGIILAGGEGDGLQDYIREQSGSSIPKQFCAFLGRRSMLERTVRRARLLIPSERLVVVGAAHRDFYIHRNLGNPPPVTVLLQPADRDTTAGILLPLIHILRKDPDAVVAILPSDHFILPGRRFMRAIGAAVHFLANQNVDCPILLAVKPDRPEPEYDWIEPGEIEHRHNQLAIRRIMRVVEKPPRDRAERLMTGGWLWNTMVMVVRARGLMDLVWTHVPELASRFNLLQRFLGSVREQDFIKEVYEAIPNSNFLTSVLARRDVKSLVLLVEGVYWSDWETKERIFATATAIGLKSSISVRTPHAPVTFPR